MKTPRRTAPLALVCFACCTAAVLAGCSGSDARRGADSAAAMAPAATDTAAAAAGRAPAATPVSLADVAGTWHLRAVPESGADTSATEMTLTATRDSSGWKETFKNGLAVPMRVSASGDSVIADAGPYASVRRKGVQVTTHSVFRKQGDRLVGRSVARYNTKGADSVLTLRTEGTRAP